MSQSKGKNEKLKQLMIDFSRNQQMIARFQPYIDDFSVLGGEKKKENLKNGTYLKRPLLCESGARGLGG